MIESFVESQKDKLSSYCAGKFPKINTGVNYFSQRNNYTMPHRTCNSSSNAMYLDWLRLATYRTPLPGSDDAYLKKVLSIGDTIEHWVQTSAIKSYGFDTKWMEDFDFDLIKALLSAGFPVPVNILHRGTEEAPTGGHVICLIGNRNSQKTLVAHDPYGSLSSGYQNTNGAYSLISWTTFERRWQGGARILK